MCNALTPCTHYFLPIRDKIRNQACKFIQIIKNAVNRHALVFHQVPDNWDGSSQNSKPEDISSIRILGLTFDYGLSVGVWKVLQDPVKGLHIVHLRNQLIHILA